MENRFFFLENYCLFSYLILLHLHKKKKPQRIKSWLWKKSSNFWWSSQWWDSQCFFHVQIISAKKNKKLHPFSVTCEYTQVSFLHHPLKIKKKKRCIHASFEFSLCFHFFPPLPFIFSWSYMPVLFNMIHIRIYKNKALYYTTTKYHFSSYIHDFSWRWKEKKYSVCHGTIIVYKFWPWYEEEFVNLFSHQCAPVRIYIHNDGFRTKYIVPRGSMPLKKFFEPKRAHGCLANWRPPAHENESHATTYIHVNNHQQ